MEVKNKTNLTDRQKWVLYQVVDGIKNQNKMICKIGGFAGTGKTTLIKYIIKYFPDFLVCAYTGKAANVLRKKGISNAATIHSLIYKPHLSFGEVYWDLAESVPCSGFIVDEASMVSSDIFEDLQSFGIPIIFVGDHGQLEPIDSNFNLMEKPDYTLEEIHRNAGDIAKFAERLRKGFSSRGFKSLDNSVEFIGGKKLSDNILMDVSQVICAFNKTRVDINNQIRSVLGYEGFLNVGERVMCLRNNKTFNLFNGMQGVVKDIYQERYRTYIDFEFDNMTISRILLDKTNFGKESYDIKHGKDTPNPFDYAYCITAHKSQGDEFDSVLVLEQQCKNWSHKRWAYTAASRAKNKLIWKY